MRSERHGDGAWMMLWPLAMAIGIWGIGLMYNGITAGQPTFWPGLALLCGGGFLSGRWVAQARRRYRAARGARRPVRPCAGRRTGARRPLAGVLAHLLAPPARRVP